MAAQTSQDVSLLPSVPLACMLYSPLTIAGQHIVDLRFAFKSQYGRRTGRIPLPASSEGSAGHALPLGRVCCHFYYKLQPHCCACHNNAGTSGAKNLFHYVFPYDNNFHMNM